MTARTEWNPGLSSLTVREMVVSPAASVTCVASTSALSTYHLTVAVVAVLLTITASAVAEPPWLTAEGTRSSAT